MRGTRPPHTSSHSTCEEKCEKFTKCEKCEKRGKCTSRMSYDDDSSSTTHINTFCGQHTAPLMVGDEGIYGHPFMA